MNSSTLALAAALALAGIDGADAAPANTLKDMFAALNQCLGTVRLPVGTEVTLRFQLNRRGGVIGKPMLTHALWPRDADPREAAAAVASGFDRCLPLAITDALGGAIAGRPIVFRLRSTPKEQKAYAASSRVALACATARPNRTSANA